jgi:hypothetical protein
MSKLQDERAKLSAAFLNNVSVGMVVAALVVPAIANSYESTGAVDSLKIIVFGVSWTIVAAVLHFFARLILRGLSE